MVHAVGHRERALPVDGAERRFERIGAAEARRPDGGAPRVRAERHRQHPRRNRGGGAARRSAGRAARVERIARPRRIAAAEAHCDGLADQDRAAQSQGADAGCIGHRLMAFEQLAAELGRHVVGLDQVLDADWHAIDHAERPAGLVSRAGFICGLARPAQIKEGERHHLGLKRLDAFDAALEIGPRRIRAVAEFRRNIVEAQHPMGGRVVGARRRSLAHVQHQISFDVTGSPSSTCPATSKLTNCDCTCWVTA